MLLNCKTIFPKLALRENTFHICIYLLLCGRLGKRDDMGHWRKHFVGHIFLDGCLEGGLMSGESTLLII